MEELFKNKTKCSKKEYNMFVKAHQKEYGLQEKIYTIIYAIFFIFFIIYFLSSSIYIASIILTIITVVFLAYRILHPNIVMKRELKSKKIQNEEVNTFTFYKYFFRIKNKQKHSNMSYFKIYKVLENKTHFYIYINSKRAFVLSKQGFIKGNVEDFSKFLRKRVWFKYKKTQQQSI